MDLPVYDVKIVLPVGLRDNFRLIDRIDDKFAHIIHQFGNELFHVLAWHAEVRIGIDFDEPDAIVFID